MTIFFPDISQYTPVPLAGAPVAIARATISTVTDTHWRSNVDDAAAHGVPLLAYCFLNAGSLGVSAEAQADYAFSVVGTRPTMLDHEPNRGACASLSEACRWIDRFRSHGGVVNLHYLPRWAWSGSLGSPSLAPLADRGINLVSSNYTSYSDTGPGWAAYGGMNPVQWQYSSTHQFNGVAVDWNAYRGTVEDYLAMAGWKGTVMSDADIPDTHRRAYNLDEAYMATGLARLSDSVTVVLPDGSKVAIPFAAATLLKRIDANVAADLAEDKATTAALKALADLVNSSGGDIDAAPILAAIADVKAAESSTVTALHDQIADLQRRLAAAAKAQNDALGG